MLSRSSTPLMVTVWTVSWLVESKVRMLLPTTVAMRLPFTKGFQFAARMPTATLTSSSSGGAVLSFTVNVVSPVSFSDSEDFGHFKGRFAVVLDDDLDVGRAGRLRVFCVVVVVVRSRWIKFDVDNLVADVDVCACCDGDCLATEPANVAEGAAADGQGRVAERYCRIVA